MRPATPTLSRFGFLGLTEYLRVRGHASHEPHVAADHRALTDHRVTPEDGGARVDRHVVLDGGVALAALGLAALRAPGAERAQGDPLIHLDSTAEHRGFADHDAGAVVEKKTFPDFGTGVNVHAGQAVRVLGDDARNDGNALLVQHVSDAVRGDRFHDRIAEYDFFHALGGGVALERGQNVRVQDPPELGDAAQQTQHDLFTPARGPALLDHARLLFVSKGARDLIGQDLARGVQLLAQRVAKVGAGQRAVAVKAHVDHGLQVIVGLNDLALVGERGAL